MLSYKLLFQQATYTAFSSHWYFLLPNISPRGTTSLVPNNANDIPARYGDTGHFSLEDPTTRDVPLEDGDSARLLQSHRDEIASSTQRELTW